MIVSLILKEAFKGLTLTYKEFKLDNTEKGNVEKPVLFYYGDQKELNRFITNRSNLENFPLVWYVQPPFERDPQDLSTFNTRATIVLFTGTRADMYNEERAEQNYQNILYPLADLIINTMNKKRNITILGKTSEDTDANFGLNLLKGSNGNGSATPIYADGWAITVELNIKKPCTNG